MDNEQIIKKMLSFNDENEAVGILVGNDQQVIDVVPGNSIDKIIKQLQSGEVHSYELHDLELAEYVMLKPEETGLPVKIFFDDCSSYRRWNHPMWVIVSKGNPYESTWVALSVSEKPEVICNVLNPKDFNSMTSEDIRECKEWVSKYYTVIKSISNELVDAVIVYDIMDVFPDYKKATRKDIDKSLDELKDDYIITDTTYSSPLNEMATLRMQDTNLSFMLWLEPDVRMTNHNIDRIKFQQFPGDTDTSKFYPLLLTPSGAYIKETDKMKCKASKKVQREVVVFVNKYRRIIDAYLDSIINLKELKMYLKTGITELPK